MTNQLQDPLIDMPLSAVAQHYVDHDQSDELVYEITKYKRALMEDAAQEGEDATV
jgi:hypothetical protein